MLLMCIAWAGVGSSAVCFVSGGGNFMYVFFNLAAKAALHQFIQSREASQREKGLLKIGCEGKLECEVCISTAMRVGVRLQENIRFCI